MIRNRAMMLLSLTAQAAFAQSAPDLVREVLKTYETPATLSVRVKVVRLDEGFDLVSTPDIQVTLQTKGADKLRMEVDAATAQSSFAMPLGAGGFVDVVQDTSSLFHFPAVNKYVVEGPEDGAAMRDVLRGFAIALLPPHGTDFIIDDAKFVGHGLMLESETR